MLWTPKPEFNLSVFSHTGQPNAAIGATITPATNAYGSYAAVQGTPLVNDCYGIYININSIAVSAQATNSLTTIGIDAAGGTSYTDTINHLMCGAATSASQSAAQYYFPLFIPAGSTIGAKGSINNATPGTQKVFIQTLHKPSNVHTLLYGTVVESIGVVTATSRGTTVVPGTSAEGTWTSLGTTSRALWWWQQGFSTGSATMGAINYDNDLSTGDGTNQRIIIENQFMQSSAAESVSRRLEMRGCMCNVASGQTMYGRAQADAAPDTVYSMMAYGCA